MLEQTPNMTPKQEEKIRKKIASIKKALAEDKRHWGGQYHDGRGYRYMPPQYFLELQDYKGAASYFRWFQKNFPDDSAYPIFLFEWTLTLYKTNKIKEAETKALKTFMSDIYLFNTFLEKPTAEPGNAITETAHYSRNNVELIDFSEWLQQFMASEKFNRIAKEFSDIQRELENEPVGKKRTDLVNRQSELLT